MPSGLSSTRRSRRWSELDGTRSEPTLPFGDCRKFQQPWFTFGHSAERNPLFPRSVHLLGRTGKIIVIGRLYFVRQAATLLKFAKSTANPELSAVLIEKAAELKSRDGASQFGPPMWNRKKRFPVRRVVGKS